MKSPVYFWIVLILLTLPNRLSAMGNHVSEQAGANLFREKGCSYCHGSATEGTPRGPSLINIQKTWKEPQIAAQIENGGQKMPAFKESLSVQEMNELVSFLRAKRRPPPSETKSSPELSNPAQPPQK